MPLVMASAMINAATPAATPATEMAVITPTTACRRLARRYRAAMKSSKRMALMHDRIGRCRVLVTVEDAQRHHVLTGIGNRQLGHLGLFGLW